MDNISTLFATIILVFCQTYFTYAYVDLACPPGLSSYQVNSGSCGPQKLDCSNEAFNDDPLDPTLLTGAKIKQCFTRNSISLPSTTPSPYCPANYQSGITKVQQPVNGNCEFCFKVVLTRFNVYPAGTPCARRKRGDTHRLRLPTLEVPFQGTAKIPIEKIGPDEVTVSLYVYGSLESLGLEYPWTWYIPGFLASRPVEFAYGYQQTQVLIGPVTSDIYLALYAPSFGILGVPRQIHIKAVAEPKA